MEECKPDTDISNMVAVIHFHDTLEFCVRALIEEDAIVHNQGDTLMNLIYAVDKHFKNDTPPKKLPLASQISGLNTTRNNAKHHATPPNATAATNAKVHTLDFLEEVCADFLKLSFSDVSLVALVKNDNIRALLQSAERHIASSDYLNGLIDLKEAFIHAKPPQNIFLSNLIGIYPGYPYMLLNQTDPGMLDQNQLKAIAHSLQPTWEYLQYMGKRILDVEEAASLLMMGVDYKRYERFNDNTPYFDCWAGVTKILWRKATTVTHDMATEALVFALEIILEWERAGILGRKLNYGIPLFRDDWEVIQEREPD